MNFLRDNQPIIVLSLVIVGLFVMAIGTAQDFRGGNEWAFAHQKAHEIFALIVRFK